ncbi:bZIP transcription factor [Catellatospora sichuanensis]|uniref:bZIP transcription factor n=1 Tax=Catellatospora sichuanensis TaxID=1969805 RepID=UPI001182418A|nr:bZIP transcription factor [Catellatospora sichuanensis]
MTISTSPTPQPDTGVALRRGRFSFLHSPVLAGFLTLVTAGVGVWGAFTQVENKQQGTQNDSLQQSVDSLKQENTALGAENKRLTDEVATLRSAAAATPTASAPGSGNSGQPLPGEANWKVPAELTGIWQGTVTSQAGTIRYNVTLALNSDGLGKGAEAGTVRYPTTSGDCLMKVFLVEVRIDGAIKVDPDERAASDPCGYQLYPAAVISLRDGRVWFQNASNYTGALAKTP